MLKEGMKVGLGTDVSGGYSTSMLDAIRQAVIASKLVSIGNGSAKEENEEEHEPLTYAEAFHLATVGGAESLGLADRVGNFIVGKEFDALVVNPYPANSPIDEAVEEDVLQIFQKFLFLGDDRNIETIYVRGKLVKETQ
jgi:guanine deaminase